MHETISPLQSARKNYKPKLPKVLAEYGSAVKANSGCPTQSISDQNEIKCLFENTYGLPVVTIEGPEEKIGNIKAGVILSGGQAPGGHNVIAGLYDGLKRLN